MHRRHMLMCLTAAALLAAESKIRVQIRRTSKGKSAAQGGSPSLEIVLLSDTPFPVRALDPMLEVGSVRLTNFRFSGERNEVLTFYTLGNEDLRAGALMALQYGNDRSSRSEVGNFRAPE